MRLMVAGLPILLNACSVQPLPQDYSGVDTYGIVRQVRCEMRSAIQDNLIQWLNGTNRPDLQQLARHFSLDPRHEVNFSEEMFPGDAMVVETPRGVVRRFRKAGVAYDFTFDITEQNSLDTSLGVLAILRHTLGTFGFGAGVSQTRENIRTFTIADTFEGLLSINRPADYCKRYIEVNRIRYPITGRIGLAELVHQYVANNLFSNLDGVNHQGAPSMGDTITFTTRLSGSAEPKFEFGHATRGVQIGNAGLSAIASRNDVHKLIVAIALPPPEEVPEKKQEDRRPPGRREPEHRAPEFESFVGPFTRIHGTPAQVTALQQVNQIILRFELGRSQRFFVALP